MDVEDDEDGLTRSVVRELGGQGRQGEPMLPASPGSGSEVTTRTRPAKRKAPPTVQTREVPPPKRTTDSDEVTLPKRTTVIEESLTREKRNSELFPVEERPDMFKDDDKFDVLSRDRAAKICYKHSVELDRRHNKKSKQNSLEKCDDKLSTVRIPAGDDNAREKLNIEARKLIRPAVLEIEKQMEWFPTVRREVIRNLPLGVYGLQDSVSTKAI